MFILSVEAVKARAAGEAEAEGGALTELAISTFRHVELASPTDGDRAQTSFASVAEQDLRAFRRLIG